MLIGNVEVECNYQKMVRGGPNKRGHLTKDLKKSMRGRLGIWKYIPGRRAASIKAMKQSPTVKTVLEGAQRSVSMKQIGQKKEHQEMKSE